MKNVLLVEDDTLLRTQIRFSLEIIFNVLEAGDVEEALTVLKENKVEVVILDLGLPPSENTPDEGIRLLRFVIDNSPAKVIILTGQKTENAALEAIKSGAFDYIVKPVEIDKIVFSIKRALFFRDIEDKISGKGIKKISFDVEVGKGLQPAREEAERNFVLKVLKDTNFNIYKSAKILGVKRESLYYFIKKFGFRRDGYDD